MKALPRALVIAGGGARAAYEVGVLAAIAERAPGLEFPIVTGVSAGAINADTRSEEHTSELQSLRHLVCRLLLEKKKDNRQDDVIEAFNQPVANPVGET